MITEAQINARKESIKKAVSARVSKGRTVTICNGCGKEFSVHMAAIRKGGGKYCNWACRVKNMVGDKGSNAGGGSWMLGKKNINYKHGQSAEREPRDLTRVNRWRRRVFQRDKYTCQRCQLQPKTHNTLRAHHISTWAVYPLLRFVLKNGITLCNECHKWVHSKKNIKGEYICS